MRTIKYTDDSIIIRTNFDDRGYTSKPLDSDCPGVVARTKTAAAVKRVTLETFHRGVVQKGYTFTRAELRGTTDKHFMSQRLLVVDIDNDIETGKPYLSPESAEGLCDDLGIAWAFWYHTFSSTPQKPKFRVVVVLPSPIGDPITAATLNKNFSQLFHPYADSSCINLSRHFYGSSPLVGEHSDLHLRVTEIPPILLTPVKEPPTSLSNSVSVPAAPPKHTGPRPGNVDTDLDRAVDGFNLVNFLVSKGFKATMRGNGVTINPCPICGHQNDFHVSDDTPHKFYCHSRYAGGGTIYHLLIAQQNNPMSKFEAVKYLKNLKN